MARQHLDELFDLAVELSGATSSQDVARVVVGRGTQAMLADTCTLYVLDESDEALELIGDRGVAPEVLASIRRITEESGNPSFTTLRSGQPIWGETPLDIQALYPSIAAIVSEGPRARAFWSHPLIVEGQPIGLLGMGFYRPRGFSDEDRAFVGTFSGYCAQALRRAQRIETERRARKDTEHALASLATTLRSIGDAVIATDTRGAITFMNPVAEALTGWTEVEARGRPLRQVFRIVNEHTGKEVESPVDKVLEQGTVVGLANHTVLIGRGPGQPTPIDDSGAPIRDDAGVVQGVVLVFRDVREKKLAEARRAFIADATDALSSSLDYRATLTRVAELFVPRFADWCTVDVWDPHERTSRQLAVTHADPTKVALARALAERYPSSPDDTTGALNVMRTGKSELHPHITEAMIADAARDDEHLQILSGLHLRSAMTVPLLARGQILGAITAVYAESGRTYSDDDLRFVEDVARRAAIAVDNAQLYASEHRARLTADIANRTKDEFLATVSHELRTPLNAILGWSRIMSDARSDEGRRSRATEIIQRNAAAMARLIDDLLDVSRIITGRARLDRSQVTIERVIQAAVDSLRPSVDTKQIQLDWNGDQPPGRQITADAGRLQQIVTNLLSNAIKFTPSQGRIAIRVWQTDGASVIEVSDNGKGIVPDFLPHVFDPFRQADGSITRAHGGLGLGLAISRHLVELHGGTIKVSSDGEGQGATFTVTLPLGAPVRPTTTASASKGNASEAGREAPANIRGLRVLAVDDDPDARHLIQAVLKDCGASVRVAASAREAMAAIHDELPDVLLSDIGMPEEDGYSLIREVRGLPAARGGEVPAAAITAYTRLEDRQLVLNAGYAMHIPKPIEPLQLVSVVASLAGMGRRAGLG